MDSPLAHIVPFLFFVFTFHPYKIVEIHVQVNKVIIIIMTYDTSVTVDKSHIWYPNRSDQAPMLANIALLAVTLILI